MGASSLADFGRETRIMMGLQPPDEKFLNGRAHLYEAEKAFYEKKSALWFGPENEPVWPVWGSGTAKTIPSFVARVRAATAAKAFEKVRNLDISRDDSLHTSQQDAWDAFDKRNGTIDVSDKRRPEANDAEEIDLLTPPQPYPELGQFKPVLLKHTEGFEQKKSAWFEE